MFTQELMPDRATHYHDVQNLPLKQQLHYQIGLPLAVGSAFAAALGLTVLIIVLLTLVIFANTMLLETLIVTAVMPAVLGFMLATGIKSRHIQSGQRFGQVARAAGRMGLLTGFWCGFGFGVVWHFLWGFGVRFEAQQGFEFLVRPELLLWGLTTSFAVAVGFMLFHMFFTVAPDLVLQVVRPDTHERGVYE